MKKEKIRNIFTIIIAVLISLALLFLMVFIGVKTANLIQGEPSVSYFVSIFSAFIGGVCTLGGVMATLFVTHIIQKRKTRDDCKPEVYVPGMYDSADAIQIRFTYDNEPQFNVPNYHLHLKNSDKAAFKIEKIIANDTLFIPKSISYIEKNNLFCVSLFHKEKVEQLMLYIKSQDNHTYCIKALLKDDDVLLEEAGE